MKFTRLEIANFLTIGEATIHLADRGLVLIQGVNEDDSSAESNGAGKSTIPDALCWCLFGATARGESGDGVINRAAGKGCRVAVRIDDGDDAWIVARHRKHKTGKNSLTLHKLDGVLVSDHTKGTDKLTQAEVDRIVGSSYDVFRAAVYAGQEQMPDLPAMTDKQLKLLVEEAAGVTILERAYEEARLNLAGVKTEADGVAAQLDKARWQRDQVEERLDSLESDKENWESGRDLAVKTAVDEAKRLMGEAETLKREIAKTDRVMLEAALTRCDVQISAVDGEREKERKFNAAVAAAESEAAVALSKQQASQKELERQQKRLSEIDSLVGTPCGECGKEYCEHDLEEARRRQQELVNETAIERDKRASETEAARKRAGELADKRDAFRASMTDLSSIVAQRASLAGEIAILNGLETKRDKLLKEARFYAQSAKDKKTEANPILGQIEAETKRLKLIRDQIVAIEKNQAEIDTRLKVAEMICKVFSPAGVRAHILDDVTPFLNEQTAKYLATLSDGNLSATWTTLVKNAKGELREKFSIEVTNATGGETFKSISGGEKRKVRIAAALALQDLVARRATKPIELFIGDEIDDALDPAGLERLMAVLEEKARERGSVLIISHNSLRDWVSQVMVVTKRGAKSFVEEISS